MIRPPRTGGQPPVLMDAILMALVRHPGGLTLNRLVDEAYQHREDGGPVHAEGCIRHTVKRLRDRGVPIERTARGYALTPGWLLKMEGEE